MSEESLKIECRRSLHAHACDARARGWTAAEWEEWTEGFARVLVETIGDSELQCIIKVVWKLL